MTRRFFNRRTTGIWLPGIIIGIVFLIPSMAQSQVNVITVDCTPFVSPPAGSFGPTYTMGMALQLVDLGGDFIVTEVTPAAFRAMTAAQLATFDLIAVNNHPQRLGDGCMAGMGNGLGATWQGVVGVNSGGRVVLNSHDAPRFKLQRIPPAAPLFTGFEPFGTKDLVRQSALWAGGVPGKTGLLIFNDAARFFTVGGAGWNNLELNLPAVWGISDQDQTGGNFTNGGYTDILPAFAAHPIYLGLSDVRGAPNTISSFSANIGDTSFHSVFGAYNPVIFMPTEVVINSGIVDVGGMCFCAGNAARGPDGVAITLIRDAGGADAELVTINKGQPKKAVECAAPGPNNEVHPANGRALAHDPDHNELFYTESSGGTSWDVIFKVDPTNAQPMGGVPQVCQLIDSCQVVFPDGTPMPIGAMAYQDRNDFDPPAPFDILWLAPYDSGGFGGIGDIWQLAIDTDDPTDQFYPQRDPANQCQPTLVTHAPLGRGPQCPNIGNGFPDGMDFDPSPDLPGMNSIWISDDASDIVDRLIFPESPALTYKVEFLPEIEEHFLHKCNTAIAVDPTGGANPIWLNEFAIDFRLGVSIEEVYLSQRPRNSLNPWVFEAAAYDQGLFGADPNDLGVQNSRAWEDGEFDETLAFESLGHRCGVWMVDDGTTILRGGTMIASNELTLIRFDVPCGKDETEILPIGERAIIALTPKVHNNGPADPADIHTWEQIAIPEGCEVSYLAESDEEIVIAAGVNYFELLADGTLLPLGVGPAILVPGPGVTIVAQGLPGLVNELQVHTHLPGSVPVGVPVNYHQEFDKRCTESGTKEFEFCVEVMPVDEEDPDPDNNSACVTEIVEVPEACDPDPHSQGYWHRQCMGAGLITPGRNGRGPTTILEPNFLKDLVPAVDLQLQASIFLPPTFLTCEDGMDAEPPNDPCQRALKQYTAMLLNMESGRLQNSCDIDLSAEGCSSTTIGDLVNELAGLINSGDPNDCKQAADCAGTINEGLGIVAPASGGTPASSSIDPGETEDPATGDENPVPTPVEETSSESPQILQTAGWSAEPETVDLDTAEPIVVVDLTSVNESPEVSVPESAGKPLDADIRKSLNRHFAVLIDSKASDEVRADSQDALLTALGGGYEPKVRLRIIRGLVGNVDEALNSLLAIHLEDIQAEAEELGNKKQAREARRLLKALDSGEESEK